MKTRGYHQEAPGRLTIIDELTRADVKTDKVSYLCICDCGNWYITRTDAFNKGGSDGGSFSCGCLNKESYTRIFSDKEVIEKRTNSIIQTLEKQGRIPHSGDIINDWKIMETKVEDGRRYARAICPYCKNLSHWIRYDGIENGHVLSCGCRSSYFSKAVENICKILDENNIKYITEKTFDDCIFEKTGKKGKFDFYVNNYYIIEYDGEQHFKPGFGHGQDKLLEIQERDRIKNEYCFKHNIPIIRIPYTCEEITLEELIPNTSHYLLRSN